jgi:hypothetical protein
MLFNFDRPLQQRVVPLSILGISSNTQINRAKRGTSEYSRALAAILWSRHTHILQISPSATGMVRYAVLVLWYPIKLVAILLFGEVPWCPALQWVADGDSRIVVGITLTMLLSWRHGCWLSHKVMVTTSIVEFHEDRPILIRLSWSTPANQQAAVNCSTFHFLFCCFRWILLYYYFIPNVQTCLQQWKFLFILLWVNSIKCRHI